MKKLIVLFFLFFSGYLFSQEITVSIAGLSNQKIDVSKNFIGLFKVPENSESFMLKEVEISVKKQYNPMIGDSTTSLRFKDQSKSIMLINGVELKLGEIKGKSFGEKFLYPNESIEYKFNGTTYKIEAQVDNVESFDNGSKKYINYALVLKVNETTVYNLVKFNEVLYTRENFIEGPEVKWIGDIDSDGLLDLIISESNHYAALNRTLYLTCIMTEKNYTEKISINGAFD
jgi:hypothetical protein